MLIKALDKHAFDKKQHAERAGEEHRRVAEGDNDDVGSEPEIGIEHCPHQLKGVSLQAQVVGDDQRANTDQRRHPGTKSIAVKALHNQSQRGGTPANEDG